MTAKKFYRKRNDKMIAGVCSGVAEYFNIDATLVRIGWVAITLAGGAGLLAYIICLIIVPEEPFS